MHTLPELFDVLWQAYVELCPDAAPIHALLAARGETVVNDHIALRTFDDPRIGLDVLAAAFTAQGYQPKQEYRFEDKHLFARHFEHGDAGQPKIFISELCTSAFSDAFQARVRGLVDQLPANIPGRWDLPALGRPWDLSYDEHEALRTESEYAAWLAAVGFRPNHFTISVNALTSFASLSELNDFLEANGFALNASGGKIKGTPDDRLEQSSTLAGEIVVSFSDGPHTIPGCYYEFARRYPDASGRLFSGFVPGSASKIFESTDRR